MDRIEARKRYHNHKSSAKSRGIEFDLTFDEWLDIWKDRLDLRGMNPDSLQMCRTADEGAYRPGNVRIDTAQANRDEASRTAARRALIRGWTIEGSDRSELRTWLEERHAPFQNPMHVLQNSQQSDDDDGW